MIRDPWRLPWLGAGLGYRSPLADFLRGAHGLGCVELMPEHVIDAPPDERDALMADATRVRVVTHGVSLSIGSAEGPDEDYLRALRDVSAAARAPWASDHLCFRRVGARELAQLVPVPYTQESLDVIVQNVERAQSVLGIPLALENVTRWFAYDHEDYSEPEFLRRLGDATGCFLLLDVTNVWNNAVNLGLDAERYLKEFPLERVIHVHLGGVHDDGAGGLLDTHAGPVPEPVWRLAQRVIEEAPVRAMIIERDDELGDLGGLAAELRRAADMMEAERP